MVVVLSIETGLVQCLQTPCSLCHATPAPWRLARPNWSKTTKRGSPPIAFNWIFYCNAIIRVFNLPLSPALQTIPDYPLIGWWINNRILLPACRRCCCFSPIPSSIYGFGTSLRRLAQCNQTRTLPGPPREHNYISWSVEADACLDTGTLPGGIARSRLVRTPWVITEVSTGGPTNGHDVYPFQRYQRCSRGSWWKIVSKAGALIEFKSPQTSAKSQPLGWKNGLDSPVGMCVTYDCVLNDLVPTAECDGLGDKYCKSFAKDS